MSCFSIVCCHVWYIMSSFHHPHQQALSLATQELLVFNNIREKYDSGNWYWFNRAWQSRSISLYCGLIYQAATPTHGSSYDLVKNDNRSLVWSITLPLQHSKWCILIHLKKQSKSITMIHKGWLIGCLTFEISLNANNWQHGQRCW